MTGLNRLLDLVELMDSDDAISNRQQALVQYSLMVGTLTLARAARDAYRTKFLEAAGLSRHGACILPHAECTTPENPRL